MLFFPRSALVVSRYPKGWAPYLSVLSYEAFKRIVCRVCDMLWPVRHIIACFFCHEVIHSACCLIVEFDCESVMASEAYNCLFCHEVIHSASCLIDDRDCENVMASEAYNCLFLS